MTTRSLERNLLSLDDAQLEQWVLTYVNSTFQTVQPARRNGRSGQKQDGVDVYAVIKDVGFVGFQAKAYVKTELTPASFDKELAEAHKFKPPLARYTIVTLGARDARLQERARLAELHRQLGVVEVLFLEDLAEITVDDEALHLRVLEMTTSAKELEYSLAPYLIDTGSRPFKVLPIESDRGLPPALRLAEEWIDAGLPRRALDELASYTGAITLSSRRRIECRAHYALQDYAKVVEIAEKERTRPDMDATVVAVGAYAAIELGEEDQADEWLELALARATEENRKDVVAARLRARSRRVGAQLPELEAYATSALGDPAGVAVALGDAAANLNDRRRALFWYEQAKKRRPITSLGAQINHATSALSVAIEQTQAGEARIDELDGPLRLLEDLRTRVRDCESPSYPFVVLNALGFAYEAVGAHQKAAAAWDEALSSCDENLGLWVRRCVLSSAERIPVPDDALIKKHVKSPMAGLALAMAMTINEEPERAKVYIQSVLDDEAASAHERAVAQVEMMRANKALGNVTNQEMVSDALGALAVTPQAVPLLSWIILHYADATGEQQAHIRSLVNAADPSLFDDDALLALATLLENKELGALAVRWLPRIEPIAFDAIGQLRDRETAQLVANLYLRTLRYRDAISVRTKMAQQSPSSPGAIQQLARAFLESGDRETAYRTLEDAVRAGAANIRTALNWAMLANALGHRRRARRIMLSAHIPSPDSKADFVRLLQARALLGLRGQHDDILAGLRKGFVTPDNAGVLFGLGLRWHSTHKRSVSFGSIVTVNIPGVYERTVFIAERPSQPLPRIDNLDAETHPWIRCLLGARSGDLVDISTGPFRGKQAAVANVFDATDWLVVQARELISISTREQTGVETISGEIDEQLAVTKEMLQRHRDAVTESMTLATQSRMPITCLADLHHTSPREFLQAGGGWVPTSYSGTQDEINQDDKALAGATEFVFDPVTVLLLAAIGARNLVSSLPNKPTITRHAAWQLFDWYLLEREGRRATGNLGVGDDGQLTMTEYGVRRRVAMLQHWRDINSMIIDDFRVVDSPPLPEDFDARSTLDLVGIPSITGMMVAAREKVVLVSEEHLVRCAARDTFASRSASLHRLICYAVDRGWVSRTKATMWVARLIQAGWTWVSFPSWMLEHTMRFDDPKRWQLAAIFFKRLPIATPDTSVQAILSLLNAADRNAFKGLDLPRLRRAACIALPRGLAAHQRHAYVSGYARDSRNHRATAKALRDWASGR